MKVVCDKLSISNGLELVKVFESLDITSDDVNDFITPVVLTTSPDYYSHKGVGFYPNMSSHLSSLVLSGYEKFRDFVSLYSEYSSVEFKLLDYLNESFKNFKRRDDSMNSLLYVLRCNRTHLKDFVEHLKLNRPVDLSSDFDSFEDLISDKSKSFFISHLTYFGSSVKSRNIFNISEVTSLAPFNLKIGAGDLYPAHYKELITKYYKSIEEFDLDLAVTSVLDEFPIGNPYLKYDVSYDLIYDLIESWGVS